MCWNYPEVCLPGGEARRGAGGGGQGGNSHAQAGRRGVWFGSRLPACGGDRLNLPRLIYLLMTSRAGEVRALGPAGASTSPAGQEIRDGWGEELSRDVCYLTCKTEGRACSSLKGVFNPPEHVLTRPRRVDGPAVFLERNQTLKLVHSSPQNENKLRDEQHFPE